MRKEFPVPKSKCGAHRSHELSFESVNDSGFLNVHQPQEPCFIVEQDPHSIRFSHQRHRNHLTVGHGEPLPLSIAEHPGGAVITHTLVSGHQCICDPQTKLLGLFNRDLPIVSSAAYLFVAKHDSPLSESLGVLFNVGGVQAKHAVDDAGVFLEEVQAAVSCAFIEPELKV